MNKTEALETLNMITYKPGWSILCGEDVRGIYVQACCETGICSVTKKPAPWKGRKQYVSEWMCKQEIVGIAFSLIRDAEMHEVHEWFRYKGASIFNPHLNPDALADLASKQSSFCVRADSMKVA